MENNFAWDQFSVGFWHPFGPHGGETPEEILARKTDEISQNGWTLWSFASRSNDPEPELIRLSKYVKTENPERVFSFCSNSVTTKKGEADKEKNKEPIGEKFSANSYRHSGSRDWQAIPDTVKIPHHFGMAEYALAFKVRQIHLVSNPAQQPPVMIEWLDASGRWRSEQLAGGAYYPTRGEYLIRLQPSSPAKLRPVRAILELAPPYITAIKR